MNSRSSYIFSAFYTTTTNTSLVNAHTFYKVLQEEFRTGINGNGSQHIQMQAKCYCNFVNNKVIYFTVSLF